MYDAIVAGAGPAGSAAAMALAELGGRVLLADRCALPRYKSCSGMLIRKTLVLAERYFDRALPAEVSCAPAENRGMVFTDSQGREYRFEQTGLNVWRSGCDYFWAKRAEERGAELRDKTPVLACREEGDGIAVSLGGALPRTERARYLIVCEGVTGSLRRRLTGAERDFVTTFQTFSRGTIELDPHYFYAYLQPELSGYDAWFNVKDNQLVLGVSSPEPKELEAYYRRFTAYMEECHGLRLEETIRGEKWLMPRVRPGCPVELGRGRVLFAGEAAGFLNPMGEGISAALESGHQAALAAAAFPDRPDRALAAYREETEALRSYMIRQWQFTARLAGSFQEMA